MSVIKAVTRETFCCSKIPDLLISKKSATFAIEIIKRKFYLVIY